MHQRKESLRVLPPVDKEGEAEQSKRLKVGNPEPLSKQERRGESSIFIMDATLFLFVLRGRGRKGD